ncbi:hypothetical protein BH09VER1_BH09VER1_07500 [soil metagenome]
MKTYEPYQRIDCRAFGEKIVCFGDINGDGKIEIVIPQFTSCPEKRASAGGYPHEKTNRCVTALDLAGNILWQQGTPLPFDRRRYHGGISAMLQDLNGDGCEELVLASTKDNVPIVQVRRGTDGELVAERETGANYDLVPCDMRGLGAKRDFLLGTGLSLVFAYDENLNPLWDWSFHYGGGHEHAAVDVEGKGRDDLFIGVSRLDASGRRIWWRPDLDDAMEGMDRCPHIDHVYVHQLYGGNKDYQVLWLGGRDAVCLDALDGSLIWRVVGDHLQEGAVGRFDPANPDKQIYMFEKGASAEDRMVDAHGKTLWTKPVGRCETVRGIGPDGADMLISRMPAQHHRPCLIDHLGNVVADFEFPYDPPDRPVAKISHLAPRHSDMGYGATTHAVDLDGDGKLEIAINDREWIYLYKLDQV